MSTAGPDSSSASTEPRSGAAPPRPREALVRACLERSSKRLEFWTAFLNEISARQVVEVGVYRGDFAAHILNACPSIDRYYMVDPWRHLDAWNKPANREDEAFEGYYAEALEKTSAHEKRRVVLRGRTTDVVDEVPDESLDFVYVDGDHTLRGVTIDLVGWHEKVRRGGWIGGDDFRRSIWQHGQDYEPTLVFPFAVYFAEAVGTRIYGLPHAQFLIEKDTGGFEFVDLTGKYERIDLLSQLTELAAPKPEPEPEPPAPSVGERVRKWLRAS
jgi:predicted O-methyltransferase YrrM